jgi:cytochrome c biogenesis protein CcmG/thiol:disulfide interchange protein DsbE
VPIGSAVLGVLVVLGIASWAVTSASDDEPTPATAPPQTTPGLEETGKARPGERAPGFTVPNLDDGATVTLGSLRGQPLVVNFWASWCVPCRKEFPALAAAADRYPEVTIVGITWHDLPDDARAFADEMDATWLLLDGNGNDVGDDYGIRGVPQTLFITPDGVIQQRLYSQFASEDQLDGFIDDLLAASAPR